jgi:hypothetical protein
MPQWIERFAGRLAQVPRSQKRLLMLFADVIGIPLVLSLVCAHVASG